MLNTSKKVQNFIDKGDTRMQNHTAIARLFSLYEVFILFLDNYRIYFRKYHKGGKTEHREHLGGAIE